MNPNCLDILLWVATIKVFCFSSSFEQKKKKVLIIITNLVWIVYCVLHTYFWVRALWSSPSPFHSRPHSIMWIWCSLARPGTATWTECDTQPLFTPADCQLGAKSINNFLSSVHQKNCLMNTRVHRSIFWQE